MFNSAAHENAKHYSLTNDDRCFGSDVPSKRTLLLILQMYITYTSEYVNNAAYIAAACAHMCGKSAVYLKDTGRERYAFASGSAYFLFTLG